MPKFVHQDVFGRVSCDQELELYQNEYSDYFFAQAPFNDDVLDPEAYLIVGRRGAGKSSLIQFFNFQTRYPNALHIDVDEPEIYEEVLSSLATCTGLYDFELAGKRLVRIWEYAIWHLTFAYIENDRLIQDDTLDPLFIVKRHPAARILKRVFDDLRAKRVSVEVPGALPLDVTEEFEKPEFAERVRRVMKVISERVVFLSIDSLERHAVENGPLTLATASLIEAASNFNRRCAPRGMHIKVFISAELFPHLAESGVSNTLKYIRRPVFLHWRPKDIIRLLSYRLHKFLEKNNFPAPHMKDSDWDNFSTIRDRIWFKYFGRTIINQKGIQENTFAYVLRHSQMRPRQVVELCNLMATKAIALGDFPNFSNQVIVSSVAEHEAHLATEIVNSYQKIYPNVARIIEALSNLPSMMTAKTLHQIAGRTAAQWHSGDYDRDFFVRIIAEMGVIGKVRHHNVNSPFVAADFEYNMDDRLTLPVDRFVVVHPLFMRKLSIQNPRKIVVYPFPDGSEYPSITEGG